MSLVFTQSETSEAAKTLFHTNFYLLLQSVNRYYRLIKFIFLRDYPGKLTQRKIKAVEEISEHLDCLSEEQRARIKLQKTIPLPLSQKGKAA